MQTLLLEPLGLTHSRFFSDEIVGFNVAASHVVVDRNLITAQNPNSADAVADAVLKSLERL